MGTYLTCIKGRKYRASENDGKEVSRKSRTTSLRF